MHGKSEPVPISMPEADISNSFHSFPWSQDKISDLAQ